MCGTPHGVRSATSNSLLVPGEPSQRKGTGRFRRAGGVEVKILLPKFTLSRVQASPLDFSSSTATFRAKTRQDSSIP